MHPSLRQLLQYFGYNHLAHDFKKVSKKFHDLAHNLAEELPDGPEKTVALRKLLEAKDCAVRSLIPPSDVQDETKSEVQKAAENGFNS